MGCFCDFHEKVAWKAAVGWVFTLSDFLDILRWIVFGFVGFMEGFFLCLQKDKAVSDGDF